MKLSESSLFFIKSARKHFCFFSFLLFCCCLYCAEEGTISLDDESSKQADAGGPPPTKAVQKDIKSLYKSAERYRSKKEFIYAVEKYKAVLEKDPYNKKARERISDMYTKIKYELDEKILYKSEEVYYSQSVLYYINNDLTAAINEWGKCLAITPMNDEVRHFFEKTKGQLAEEYQREKQKAKEAKVKKLLDAGVELFNSAKYNESEDKFQEVLRLNPGHVSATFYLEQIDDIRNAAAGKAVKKPVHRQKKEKEPEAISIDYDKAENFYNQGLQEYAAGHLNEAIDSWKSCLKYNPSHEKAQVNIEKAKAALNNVQ